MRIELRDFARAFVNDSTTLLESIDNIVSAIHSFGEPETYDSWLESLFSIRATCLELAQNADKQRAYLLIFGPLKSGKSTLMNAISGAYVSEVSSLPAYPCLVYVNNAETARFELTTFSGTRECFTSNTELQRKVRNGHESLARTIRECEKNGRVFDPARDLPEAIRRVDIGIPAPHLGDSGATLVDTPGLYSKMKFGYDLLTREFQHNAACALFVVKTDNLFLEQVFDEFQELLGFFSRIFLIVNIDSAKKDIGPDGGLVPSLESSEPRRIIEAFEDLTMNAPLRDAIDEGRLRVCLIDLLQAASRSLHGENLSSRAGDAPDSATKVGPVTVRQGRNAFADFIADLTDYLNSTNYSTEFIQDTVRKSNEQAERLRESFGHPSVRELETAIKTLSETVEQERKRLEAIARLEGIEWPERLKSASAAVLEDCADANQTAFHNLCGRLRQCVADWFHSENSLHHLFSNTVAPEREALGRSAAKSLQSSLNKHLGVPNSGFSLSPEERSDAASCNLSLAGFLDANRSLFDTLQLPQSSPGLIETSAMPVKRRWIDWLLFRSRARTLEKLIGPEKCPDLPISSKRKQKQLGAEGCAWLEAAVVSTLDRNCIEGWAESLKSALQQFAEIAGSATLAALDVQRSTAIDAKQEAEAKLTRLHKIHAAITSCRTTTAAHQERLRSLAARYRRLPQTSF